MAAFLLVVALLAPTAAGPGWRVVARDDGITVWQRPVPGRDLPAFAGAGRVDAPVPEVLAVIMDVDRVCEWRDRCVEQRVLREYGDWDVLVYARTRGTWPAADRDAVLRSRVHVAPNGDVIVGFASVPGAGPRPDGAIRMPLLQGHWRLRPTGDATRVEFVVSADPGGGVPRWMARRFTRDVPANTIRNLRRQVARTRGQYAQFVHRWQARGPR